MDPISLPWWAVGLVGLVLGVLATLGIGRRRRKPEQPQPGPVAPPAPEPPKHTANEHEDKDSAHEADAIATAADNHGVAAGDVADLVAWADEHRDE